MTTLIAVHVGGRCIGRCDARCYDARSRACKCVCHGANHAMGYHVALDQTLRHHDAWLERYLSERGLDRGQAVCTGRGVRQLEMPLSDTGAPSLQPEIVDLGSETVFWTVYDRPIDRPDRAVARRWLVSGGLVRPDSRTIEAADLPALRARMPEGFEVRPRRRDDHPAIAEAWVRGSGDAGAFTAP